MFAENPHAEYVFRDDGTRVYSHNPDANRYWKLNDVGKCVQVCTASASCRAPLCMNTLKSTAISGAQ